MARADVPTHGLQLLNRWPVVMREVPYRFNQINGEGVLQLPACQNRVYVQYEREYILQALYDAAVQAREYLGYAPAPMWFEDEIVPVDCDLSWDGQQLITKYGYVQAFGRRATTLIDDAVDVEYTDEDEDGTQETATLATISGVEDIAADEIQVFFRVADGAEAEADERWQIDGLTITKSGDTATITGPRWLFVHPELWAKEYVKATVESNAGWAKNEGDVKDEDNFVTQVDVYRVYADPTNAVELLGNPKVTTSSIVLATADLTNAEQGYFTLRTGDDQTAPSAAPMSVRVSYKAGFPLKNGLMDAQFERAIVRYANTLMAQEPEMCDRTAAMWKDDSMQSPQASQYEMWHPPAFGVTKAGMTLMQIVNARYNRLKGKSARATDG